MNSQTLPKFLYSEKLVWRDDAAVLFVSCRRSLETSPDQKPGGRNRRGEVAERLQTSPKHTPPPVGSLLARLWVRTRVTA